MYRQLQKNQKFLLPALYQNEVSPICFPLDATITGNQYVNQNGKRYYQKKSGTKLMVFLCSRRMENTAKKNWTKSANIYCEAKPQIVWLSLQAILMQTCLLRPLPTLRTTAAVGGTIKSRFGPKSQTSVSKLLHLLCTVVWNDTN